MYTIHYLTWDDDTSNHVVRYSQTPGGPVPRTNDRVEIRTGPLALRGVVEAVTHRIGPGRIDSDTIDIDVIVLDDRCNYRNRAAIE